MAGNQQRTPHGKIVWEEGEYYITYRDLQYVPGICLARGYRITGSSTANVPRGQPNNPVFRQFTLLMGTLAVLDPVTNGASATA